jgi:hypothetical protein
MALKDWRKVNYKKGKEWVEVEYEDKRTGDFILIYKDKIPSLGTNWTFAWGNKYGKSYNYFKSKSEAIKFAKEYMRKN